MDYRIDQDGQVRIVRLHGPTDVRHALELRELLGSELSGRAARVLLDLREVTLVDSSGVGVFVAAHRRAAQAGAAFALAAPGRSVGRVFQLTRTDRLLRIFDTVEDGLLALRAA
jgi:stage II sporulation protein AA (anti-sigma F factor antagonist)